MNANQDKQVYKDLVNNYVDGVQTIADKFMYTLISSANKEKICQEIYEKSCVLAAELSENSSLRIRLEPGEVTVEENRIAIADPFIIEYNIIELPKRYRLIEWYHLKTCK